MTDMFNDPRNFSDINNPTFSNSYKFEDSVSMGNFARQISHNAGVKSIENIGSKTLDVNFRADSVRQDVNTQYSKFTNESVDELGERIAPLPKSTEFALTYPMGDNKQVTKLTNIGGKVDRVNKRVRFEFDNAAARTNFRKKNKTVLSTIK